MFIGAHGKTDVIGENAIIPREPQAAAPFAGTAGVRDHLKTLDSCGEFRLDDFDWRCLAIAQVKRGGRNAVLPRTGPWAAAANLIKHKRALGRCDSSTQHQRRAAGSAGDVFIADKMGESSQYGFGDGERGRHIGVYRGREVWIDNTSRAESSIYGSRQSLVNR